MSRAPYTLIGDDRDYAIDAPREVTVAGNQAKRHPIDADCVFCLRFDEAVEASTLADSGPHGYNLSAWGSYYGAVVPGQFGNARKSTYDDRCFYRSNASAPNTALVLTDAVTIGAWLQFHDYDPYSLAHDGSIAGPNAYNNGQYVNYGFKFLRHGVVGAWHYHWVGEVCVDNGGSLANRWATATEEVEIGRWTHVAVTYDRTNITLLVNGVVAAQTAENRAIIWPADEFRYFCLVNYVDPPSIVDDLAIYSTVKSQAWFDSIVDRTPTEEEVPNGLLARDPTIASRCRARLLTRRGLWAPDRTLGSRLWTIRTMKGARAAAMIHIEEALDDLIRAGEIDAILPLEFIEDQPMGALGVRVEVRLPGEQVVPLGVVPIGEGV